MSALLVELAIPLGILRLRGTAIGGGLRSIGCPLTSMRMLPASVVNQGSTASNCGLLFWGAGFLSPRLKFLSLGGLSLLRGVRVVSADLNGPNEVRGLPLSLGQHRLLLFCQGELQAAALKTVQEGCRPPVL